MQTNGKRSVNVKSLGDGNKQSDHKPLISWLNYDVIVCFSLESQIRRSGVARTTRKERESRAHKHGQERRRS